MDPGNGQRSLAKADLYRAKEEQKKSNRAYTSGEYARAKEVRTPFRIVNRSPQRARPIGKEQGCTVFRINGLA